MKGFSLNTLMYSSAFAWVPNRSLDDTIESIARLGFDGLELGASAPHAYPPYVDAERRKQIKRLVEDAGLRISAICSTPGGSPGFNSAAPDDAEREAGIAYSIECLQLAHDLEAPLMGWLGGWTQFGQSHADAFQRTVDSLGSVLEAAQPLGVKIAVEATSEISDVLENVGDTLRLLEAAEADPAAAGALVDTLPVFFESDDPSAQFAEAGDRLFQVHLQDLEGDPAGTYNDFQSPLEQLQRQGYDGWLTIETGYAKRVVDPDGEARRALAHVRESWDAAAKAQG